MAGNAAIVLKISDDLSGIASYNGSIDGKWVLMELDGKTATLKHVFDERTPARNGADKHTFRLVVTDMKNNIAVYEAAFSRSEEHTSELQSLMRNSYAVFCLKKKKQQN